MSANLQFLDFAKSKLQAVIETIIAAKGAEFPYNSPEAALIFIEGIVNEEIVRLNNILKTPNFDESTAKTYCRALLDKIDHYLPAIGFVQRACDTSIPFELHAPFLELQAAVLPEATNLIISTDWGFSPITILYPDQFGDQFVLVGLPAAEITNPLVFPLAGHEFGHNIWRYQLALQKRIGGKLKDSIYSEASGNWKDNVRDLLDIDTNSASWKQGDLFNTQLDVAHSWAVAQCEEIFCDLVGLFIFGRSYLHAFEYLISPGGEVRNMLYPSTENRVQYLEDAAIRHSILPSKTYAQRFKNSQLYDDPREQLLISLADTATRSQVEYLETAVRTFLQEKGVLFVPSDSQVKIDEAEAAFRKICPASGQSSLSSILNAAWNIYLTQDAVWEEEKNKDGKGSNIDNSHRQRLLRELILKSSEILQLEKMGYGD